MVTKGHTYLKKPVAKSKKLQVSLSSYDFLLIQGILRLNKIWKPQSKNKAYIWYGIVWYGHSFLQGFRPLTLESKIVSPPLFFASPT